jgi:hypothetical protein
MTAVAMPLQMTKEQAMDVLRTERRYQLLKWGVRQPDGTFVEMPKSQCAWWLLVEHHLQLARAVLANNAGDDQALDRLRRVGAIALAALEVGSSDLRAADNRDYCQDTLRRVDWELTRDDAVAMPVAKAIWWLEASFAHAKANGMPVALGSVMQVVLQCFMYNDAPVRQLAEVMYNRRDGQKVHPQAVP